ncbi:MULTISPECIES: hypothetical protein [Paenibacillus]|uniref:Uncharacterized protein n=1 Tax=Paenibacillus lactis TaxID=228574 RepID=A0ABS4FJD6_9BACL|nr:hypothetical protein [Paenibacillus lactis]MBP1896300.1 hypothetical protein [Paenibacillus lactis]MCM3497263.1 hypothetical protein [Paenibacillus lactis]
MLVQKNAAALEHGSITGTGGTQALPRTRPAGRPDAEPGTPSRPGARGAPVRDAPRVAGRLS